MGDICKACHLCLNVKNQLKGELKGKSHILFLYGHPNVSQDKHDSIFKGRYFKRFKEALITSKIYKFGYHTHIMKCRPSYTESWAYERNELRYNTCSILHFANEFNDIKHDVKIIVPVGRFAYQFITSTSFLKQEGYELLVNVPQTVNNYIVYPIADISSLIKTIELDKVVDKLADYYGRQFNPQILLHNGK